jgi:hypothetical protein
MVGEPSSVRSRGCRAEGDGGRSRGRQGLVLTPGVHEGGRWSGGSSALGPGVPQDGEGGGERGLWWRGRGCHRMEIATGSGAGGAIGRRWQPGEGRQAGGGSILGR